MKKMKKVMALLLSLVMVLAMSIATFATEPSPIWQVSNTYTITINNSVKRVTLMRHTRFLLVHLK